MIFWCHQKNMSPMSELLSEKSHIQKTSIDMRPISNYVKLIKAHGSLNENQNELREIP